MVSGARRCGFGTAEGQMYVAAERRGFNTAQDSGIVLFRQSLACSTAGGAFATSEWSGGNMLRAQ